MSLICYSEDERNKVFLGSKQDAKDKEKLKKMVSQVGTVLDRFSFHSFLTMGHSFHQGITHILNCTPEKDASLQVSLTIILNNRNHRNNKNTQCESI
jgi:hypothetical protein